MNTQETDKRAEKTRPGPANRIGSAIVQAATVILAFCAGISAQMPDWRMINDRAGNKYYIDSNGKMYVSGKPEREFPVVSADGLDFCLNQGIELIRSHYKAEGLTLLKSILALPGTSGRIIEAQAKASKRINSLARTEGDRFPVLNDQASLLLYRTGNRASLANEKMGYMLTVPGDLTVLRRRTRGTNSYAYYGLLAGIVFSPELLKKGERGQGYDALLAVDSERHPHPLKSISASEVSWRKNLGPDTFIRELIEKNEDMILYMYTDSEAPFYAGIEGFFREGAYGHCVRTICTPQKFTSHRELLLQMMRNFNK